MKTKTTTPTAGTSPALTLAALEKARAALHAVFYDGRSATQAADRLDKIRRDAAEPFGNEDRKADELREAATLAKTLVDRIETLAGHLDELRALAGSGLNPRSLGGLVVSVKYHGPTDRRGSRLVATIKDGLRAGADAKVSRPFNHAHNDGDALGAAQAALDAWNKDNPGPGVKIRARGYHAGEHLFFCHV